MPRAPFGVRAMANGPADGVSTLPAEPGFILCATTHFSIFAGVVDVFTPLGWK